MSKSSLAGSQLHDQNSMIELLRTNDLVLISVIESILKQEEIIYFVADQHTSSAEGSLGFLPRRIMVDATELERARYILQDADLGGELPGVDKP